MNSVSGGVFLVSVLFVVYVVAGYPALLAVWRRRAPAPRRATGEERVISVILPVRNGERWIRRKLESLLNQTYPRERVEILVVSDGSTDRTEEAVREFGEAVRLLCIPPTGKWAAINCALAQARGELLFFTDVRQTLDAHCLSVLASYFSDPSVGVVSGELVIRRGDTTEKESVGLYWEYEKWIRKQHSQIDSVLGATGAIYMMRRVLASPLPPGTLLDDVHLPFQAFFRGYRLLLTEEARAYDEPVALEAEFRRKVRTLAGVYQLIGQFPALLGPRNRMWIHFLSHKFARLLLPYALAAMAVSSFFLGPFWSPLAVAGQALFYGLALIDPWVPRRLALKRLSSMARLFVTLMAAALCAASILFRRSKDFWGSPTTTA